SRDERAARVDVRGVAPWNRDLGRGAGVLGPLAAEVGEVGTVLNVLWPGLAVNGEELDRDVVRREQRDVAQPDHGQQPDSRLLRPGDLQVLHSPLDDRLTPVVGEIAHTAERRPGDAEQDRLVDRELVVGPW